MFAGLRGVQNYASGQKPTGMKGGRPNKNLKPKRSNHLQLTNTRNDCFVNSVIQLVCATGYAAFMKNQLPHLLDGAPPQDYKVCRLLEKLYSGQAKGQVSTSTIRRCVAQHSGKLYLDFGTQQDAEEFFRALEETLSEELIASEDFRAIRDKHWGGEEIRRLFRDNTQNGKCQQCGQYPSSKHEPFIIMQLNIPRSASSVSLSLIIQAHYSESTHTDKIRCPNCCQHDRDGVQCTNTGLCRSREATELFQLTHAPEFLFIQLLRYDGNVQKVMTLVNFEAELVLPNTEIYEPVAVLNHIGATQNSGHYVTYRRLDSGQWMLFDDAFNRPSSLLEANTVENYILLFQKKGTEPKSDLLNLSHEEVDVYLNLETERMQKNRVQCVFVSDGDIIQIEDNSPAMKSKISENTSLIQKPQDSIHPDLNADKNNGVDLLDKKCRGCAKVMERLLKHLNSKKGEQCMKRYTQEEIEKHKYMAIAKKTTNYRNNKKESINEKNKEYYANNKERIKEKKKEYYANRKESIKEKNKEYKADNKETAYFAQYYKENNETIKARRLLNYYKKKREKMTLDESISAFKSEIVWGAIYACISCHRTCFRNGVRKPNIKKLMDHTIFDKAIHHTLLSKDSKFWIKNSLWICHTCLSYIGRNSLPKMSSRNALQVHDRPDFLKLTEVENVLIAPRINFIKMIKLPVSRMTGIRDRIVNVPIASSTIKQTVESLPRTLEEAQVIPISLRKKKAMVGSHFQQYINPDKIRQAVMYLIGKYPFYEDVKFNMHKVDNIFDKIRDDCEEDLDKVELENVMDQFENEDTKDIADLEEVLDIEYIENDPVRKHQTETSQVSLLLPENIEANVKTNHRNKREKSGLILAPGEDQIPRNILKEKHPFVLHYPCLFPDGKGGLHDTSRVKKLTTQQWIMQRLLNINPMFAQNKPFLFSAVHYVEQEQLMNRMNISYMRGTMTNPEDGGKFLQTEDGFAVFDGLPGSPRYWQKMKYDLIAKMEQLGPPQFFYTLSCANKRWKENAATILAKTRPDLKVMHYLEENGIEEFLDINKKKTIDMEDYEDEDENEDEEDEVTIPKQKKNEYYVHEEIGKAALLDIEEQYKCKLHQDCSRKCLKVFLDNKTENKLQAENVLDVTRNFNNRVKAFRKNILMAKQSPLQIRYYHDRVEFQARYVYYSPDYVHTLTFIEIHCNLLCLFYSMKYFFNTNINHVIGATLTYMVWHGQT